MAEPVRLYVKGKHLSYRRSRTHTKPSVSLLRLEGVQSSEDAKFYLGKRVAYVYKAPKAVNGSNIRVIWGTITRPHGNSGVVRAVFRRHLPTTSFGESVRVMLYPSNI